MSKGIAPAGMARSGTPSLRGLMADMARWGVVFEADAAPGVTGDQVEETLKPKPKKEEPKPAPTPAPQGPSEAEVALKAELEALRARLAGYGDASAEEIKELRAIKSKAERERAEAEAAKRAAEEAKLREAGNFEELKRRMAEEAEAEKAKLQAQIGELSGQVQALNGSLVALNVNAAFQGSGFLTQETVLTPAKAAKIYGEHVELQDGKVVVFDAPRGEARRTPYVDARGNPLPFDEAIRRVVEADPDRDAILKARVKPGPGVASSGARPGPAPASEPSGRDRIKAGLGGLFGSK